MRLVLSLVLLVLVACTLSLPGSSTVINTATNNAMDQAPGVVPSPVVGGCVGAEAVASVRVNPFGYDCPDGTPEPNNNSGLLPLGCTARVTATPKDLAGNDVPAEVHGPDIAWTVIAGAQFIQVTDDPLEPFNKNVLGVGGPGEFVLTAVVCGKAGSWAGRTTVLGVSAVLTLTDFEVR